MHCTFYRLICTQSPPTGSYMGQQQTHNTPAPLPVPLPLPPMPKKKVAKKTHQVTGPWFRGGGVRRGRNPPWNRHPSAASPSPRNPHQRRRSHLNAGLKNANPRTLHKRKEREREVREKKKVRISFFFLYARRFALRAISTARYARSHKEENKMRVKRTERGPRLIVDTI